jgi:hypothetical protein
MLVGCKVSLFYNELNICTKMTVRGSPEGLFPSVSYGIVPIKNKQYIQQI